MADRVVVVGASVAGIAAARGLRTGGFDGEIVVVNGESDPPHDRPPLSKELLAGERSADDVSLLRTPEEAAEFTWRHAEPAIGLDTVRKEIRLAGGERLPYDVLFIATGAQARVLPAELMGGVHVLRGLSDALALRADLLRGGPLVVVGGGFVGAEVAATARDLGVPVTIVEAQPTPFFRVLGATVGGLLARLHEEHGVVLRTGVGVEQVEVGREGVGGVRLTDGSRLEAGTVLVGIGVTPNTGWLAGSPVIVDDGVVCDEYGAVQGADDVYAVGDVARWLDVRYGVRRRVEHWTTATEQGSLVARNLLHPENRRRFVGLPYFWSDQYGVKIQMAGSAAPGDQVEVIRSGDGRRTAALYSRGGRLGAAVTLAWPRAIATCRRLLLHDASSADAAAALHVLSGDAPAGEPLVNMRKG